MAAILNLVRVRETSTRQEIEQLSGLGRAIVADRLSTLSDLGLSHEGPLGRPTGGRAPRLVQFRADAGLILVAVLDTSSIGVAIADLSGRLLMEHHEAANLAAGPVATLQRLATLFDWLLEQQPRRHQAWGIGIALPGPVELTGTRLGSTRLHFLPNWDDYPITETLSLRYKTPVLVRNSVQMMALGELRAGSGKQHDNILVVNLGREISAGLISQGQLHRGALGAAGLIGHVRVAEGDARICRCGNTGCLEMAVGADAIIAEAKRAASEGRSPYLTDTLTATDELNIPDIGIAAQRGDAFSAELLARCGRQIGAVLGELANALNPSLIILGGEIAETGDILLAAIRESIYRHSHPLVTRDLRVMRSQMSSSGGLVGAAWTVIDKLFKSEFVTDWVALGSPREHADVAAVVARAERLHGEPPKPPKRRKSGDDGAAET
ncbi:MAG TPA: ROK family protein [Magnetospirillaceae bacterium]